MKHQRKPSNNDSKFLQALHDIDPYNIKKDFLLSRFQIIKLKDYIKNKPIQHMHNSIAKKIKFKPNFLYYLECFVIPTSQLQVELFPQYLFTMHSHLACHPMSDSKLFSASTLRF